MHSEDQRPVHGERRQAARPDTLLRIAVVTGPGPRQICLVRDLSPDGMRVRLFTPRCAGDRVGVELASGVTREARIVWAAKGEAGLFFEGEPDRPAWPSGAAAQGWRLRTPRVELDQLAMIRQGAEISFVTARDICPSGVGVESDRPLEDGQPVIFTIDGLAPMRSRVRWESEGRYGIGFDRPLAITELARWLDRQDERRA